jgi:4-carboxymuconolactone decarboxylase
MTRIATPTPDEMTPEQRRIHDDIVASRGNYLNGPFPPLMHQPHIAEPTHKLGEFVRYHTSLGSRLSELAILIVARNWDCNFEWHQHAEIALRSDVQPSIVESIRKGDRPTSLREDESVVYEFASSLLERHGVPAAVYAKATELFGVVGVVELTALLGYYTMLALSLNAHELSLPPGIEPPLPPRAVR